jgi:ABC-type branched-subunit amino acid transport system permease subunit
MFKLGHGGVAGFGKLAIAVALAAASSSAHAQNVREQANNAAIADGVTKAVSLAVGASELNPVTSIVSIGMATALFRYAESLPETERPGAYALATSVWQGTAANNACLTAAFLTGGSFTPVCVALGIAWGMKAWDDSEHERRFWERCAILREFSDQPDFPCVYTPPDKDEVVEARSAMAAGHEYEAP